MFGAWGVAKGGENLGRKDWKNGMIWGSETVSLENHKEVEHPSILEDNTAQGSNS